MPFSLGPWRHDRGLGAIVAADGKIVCHTGGMSTDDIRLVVQAPELYRELIERFGLDYDTGGSIDRVLQRAGGTMTAG